jgi:hypothetical protein
MGFCFIIFDPTNGNFRAVVILYPSHSVPQAPKSASGAVLVLPSNGDEALLSFSTTKTSERRSLAEIF